MSDMSDNSTFRVSPYAPANETAYDLWYERCNLDGAVLASVAYGVHATLFFSAASALWEQRRSMPRRTWVLLAYISAHFVMGTIAFGLNAKFNEMTFIDNRDFPGGPNGYFIAEQDNWVQFVNYVLYIIIAWLQDALLIYRYYVFWNENRWMLIIPCCLYVVSIVMGSLTLAQINTPTSGVWAGTTVNFFTSFWAVEITATIFLTGLIIARLLYMRHRIRQVVGPRHQTPYLSVAAMLAESGIMFSVGGLVFVISYAVNSPFQNMVLNMVGQIQSIAPDLIILRVARGQGLTRAKLDDASMTLKNSSAGSGPHKHHGGGGGSLSMPMSTFRAASGKRQNDTYLSETMNYDSTVDPAHEAVYIPPTVAEQEVDGKSSVMLIGHDAA